MEGSELEASFERYVATLDFINSFLEAEGFADTKNIFSKEIQSRLRHSPEAVSEGDGQEVTNSPTPDDDHDEATASLADHASETHEASHTTGPSGPRHATGDLETASEPGAAQGGRSNSADEYLDPAVKAAVESPRATGDTGDEYDGMDDAGYFRHYISGQKAFLDAEIVASDDEEGLRSWHQQVAPPPGEQQQSAGSSPRQDDAGKPRSPFSDAAAEAPAAVGAQEPHHDDDDDDEAWEQGPAGIKFAEPVSTPSKTATPHSLSRPGSFSSSLPSDHYHTSGSPGASSPLPPAHHHHNSLVSGGSGAGAGGGHNVHDIDPEVLDFVLSTAPEAKLDRGASLDSPQRDGKSPADGAASKQRPVPIETGRRSGGGAAARSGSDDPVQFSDGSGSLGGAGAAFSTGQPGFSFPPPSPTSDPAAMFKSWPSVRSSQSFNSDPNMRNTAVSSDDEAAGGGASSGGHHHHHHHHHMSATLSATRNAELQAALAAMGGAAGERPLLPHATSAGASSSVGGSSDRSTPADASGTPRHVNGSPGLAGAGGTTTASSGGGSSVAEMMGGNGGSSGGGAARKSAAAAATATASVSASAANSSGGGGGGVLLHQQELLAHMIRLSRDDMTEPSTDVDGNPQAPALPTVDEDTAASLHTQGGEDDADASAGAATLKASSPAAATALDGGIKPSSRRATATSSQLPAASGASAAAVAAGKQQGHSPSASTSSRSSPHQQQGLPQPRSSHSQSQQQQQLGEELPFDDPYPMRFTPQPVPMPSYSVGADGRVEYAWDPEFVDKKYEVLSLRVYHRKHRTGFEEHKDLPVHVDDLIAGRYHVVEFLGSAAFSKAVQAVDIKTGALVCLKIIKNNKDYLDQSLDEIKLLQYVNDADPDDAHGVVRLYDYFYFKEHLFLVCELLRANLYEYQKFVRDSGQPPWFTNARIQKVATQVLRSLAFLHSLGLIHSDLKPENILIKSYSRCDVKVIDLGSSCFVTDQLSSYVQSRSYRAPEVILGLPYDQRIDVWSLGCILAELSSGYVLLQNDSLATLLVRLEGILGPVPDWMVRSGRYSHRYYTRSRMVYELCGSTGRYELLSPKRSSLRARLPDADDGLLDFIAYLLEVDPNRRPTAAEALRHSWLRAEYPTPDASYQDVLAAQGAGGSSSSPQPAAADHGAGALEL